MWWFALGIVLFNPLSVIIKYTPFSEKKNCIEHHGVLTIVCAFVCTKILKVTEPKPQIKRGGQDPICGGSCRQQISWFDSTAQTPLHRCQCANLPIYQNIKKACDVLHGLYNPVAISICCTRCRAIYDLSLGCVTLACAAFVPSLFRPCLLCSNCTGVTAVLCFLLAIY